jgi:hypothetical protein
MEISCDWSTVSSGKGLCKSLVSFSLRNERSLSNLRAASRKSLVEGDK